MIDHQELDRHILRFLFGSDGAWTGFTPMQAIDAYHQLPLTKNEITTIDSNLAFHMKASSGH